MRGRFGLGFKRKKLDSATIAALDSIFTQAAGGNVAKVRTTRSTLATCIGPDGTLQWGPHNLYSESYALITQNVTVPAGSHIVSFSGTGSVTLSGAATGTINGTGAANRVFLLVTTTSGTLTSTVSGSVTSAQLENVTGTNRTTPSDYVDSTVKNRAPYSNDFVSGGAGWAKPAVNMYPAASTLADGTPMTLAVATATSAQHQFYVAAAAISGVATGQIMARDGGARYIQVLSAAVSDQYANFDLQTGAVTAKGAGCLWAGAVWINGAWCCSAQFNGTAATFYYSLANSPTAGWLPTFTGDGINGVYIANACTLPGTGKPDGAGGYLPIPYFYNPAAAPSVGPIYAQRTDYDPVTLACKGALIEPTQVTQLLANPDDLSNATNWAGNVTATDDGTRFRGRRMWKLAKTTTSTGEARYQYFGTAQSGHVTQKFVFQASSNSSQAAFGLYCDSSGWGANANTTSYIESGPGTLTQQNGGLWSITGLATNVPTVVITTRNRLVSEAFYVNLYPDINTSTTIGKAIYAQVDNLVAGTDGGGSFIPNPATSGTVVRVADTSSVGYDDLAKALPWLMDTNLLSYPEDFSNGWWTTNSVTLSAAAGTAPDGTNTACKIISAASTSIMGPYSSTSIAAPSVINTQSWYVMAGVGIRYLQMMWSSSSTSAEYANFDLTTGTFTGGTYLGATAVSVGGGWFRISMSSLLTAYPGGCWITAITNPAAGRAGTYAGNGTDYFLLWGAKLNPGPVAQTYYPQSSKQGCIVFEGDVTYGAVDSGVAVFSLDKDASNRVMAYKGASSNSLSGIVNANASAAGNISSGATFKTALGFSQTANGISLNGSAETLVTASALSLLGASLKIGFSSGGYNAASMHIRRLRLFNTNLPSSTKQALTR